MQPSDHAEHRVDAAAVDAAAVDATREQTYVVAEVAPLDVDGTRTVAVGTVLFAVAFVALLPVRARLEAAGHGWWLWTCLAGFGIGVVGWDYCRRRARRRRTRVRG